jgi:hypothetical protein
MTLNELKKRNTRRVFPDKKGNCLSKILFASYYIYAVVWQWSHSRYYLGLYLVGDWVYVINTGKKQVKITT